MTQIEHSVAEVNENPLQRTWRDKLIQRVEQNIAPFEDVPSVGSIVDYAADMVFEFHEDVANGKLRADNRVPSDDEVEIFYKILLSVLSRYDILDYYDESETFKNVRMPFIKKIAENESGLQDASSEVAGDSAKVEN